LDKEIVIEIDQINERTAIMSYALIALLLTLCPLSYFVAGQTVEPPTPAPIIQAIPVITEDFEGVIFPVDYLEENFGYGMNITWTPSEADIITMEAGVFEFLIQSENPMFQYSQTPPWEHLEGYKRQYYGLTIEGKNVIHAEFYCHTFDERWREEPIMVMDGGDCFFRFDYDPTTDTFFNLSVNGMA
jgi:hypothetical protein